MTSEQYQTGTITKVERQKRSKDRYNIFVDNQFAFCVHEDVLIQHNLSKDSIINTADIVEIVEAQNRQQAYLDCIRVLSSRLRSEHELSLRLKQKGYHAAIVTETLDRLRQEQYVNDALFAEQLTQQRISSQKKGRKWVKQELQYKGLQPEQISHALDQIDEEIEYASAYQLVNKKYQSELKSDPLKAKRKAIAFLQRRGYSSGIISRVMKRMGNPLGEDGLYGHDIDFE
jgi:regulatory protein